MLKETLTPNEIVLELDKHIIGQDEAKRAVAIALRNRWRRTQVAEELKNEIKPKNILMIGPTGVGKTEIARRLAALANAPFIKVEATKFTEVGYVGRDVESIIRDLVETAVKKLRELEITKVKDRASNLATERILDAILPQSKTLKVIGDRDELESFEAEEMPVDSVTRQFLRKQLLNGELDDKIIEIEVSATPIGIEIMAPPGMEEMTGQLQSMFSTLSNNHSKKKKIKVKNALKQLTDEESVNMLNEEEIRHAALQSVEQNGIVFIDEIDKITQRGNINGTDISREGVQRDLLPLVEGCAIFTKYGLVKTDHILFIASGAFHLSKPSDLIPEMQGRFPIRVELNALTAKDFVRILTEPKASLVEQYIALLQTEELQIQFSDDAIQRIAEIAFKVNEKTENIGARRLYTIMERLLEEISFTASDRKGEAIIIDANYVNNQLAKLLRDDDLARYIL